MPTDGAILFGEPIFLAADDCGVTTERFLRTSDCAGDRFRNGFGDNPRRPRAVGDEPLVVGVEGNPFASAAVISAPCASATARSKLATA